MYKFLILFKKINLLSKRTIVNMHINYAKGAIALRVFNVNSMGPSINYGKAFPSMREFTVLNENIATSFMGRPGSAKTCKSFTVY